MGKKLEDAYNKAATLGGKFEGIVFTRFELTERFARSGLADARKLLDPENGKFKGCKELRGDKKLPYKEHQGFKRKLRSNKLSLGKAGRWLSRRVNRTALTRRRPFGKQLLTKILKADLFTLNCAKMSSTRSKTLNR